MNKLHSILLGTALIFGAASASAGNTLVPSNVMPEAWSSIEVGTMISIQFDEQMHWANDYAYYDITFEKSTMGNVTPADWNGITLDWSEVQVTFNPESWALEDCDYTLTIPEGTLLNEAGEGNALIELTYSYAAGSGGGNVTGAKLAVYNNSVSAVEEDGYITNPFNVGADDWMSDVTYNNLPVTFTANGVAITCEVAQTWFWQITVPGMPSEICEAGEYALDIPEGAFTVGGAPNDAIHMEWTLSGSAPVAGYLPFPTFFPESYSEVLVGSNIIIAYDRAVMGNTGMPVVTFYNETKGESAGTADLQAGNEDYQMTFTFAPANVDAGDVITCTIAEGNIFDASNFDMINAETGAQYYVKAEGDPNTPGGPVTITLREPEAEGVIEAPLYGFMVDVPEGTTLENPRGATLYNEALDANYEITASMSTVLPTVCNLDLPAAISDPGNYVLTLAAGMFANGTATNEATTFHFTIGGGGQYEFKAKVVATNPSFTEPVAMFADGSSLTVTLSDYEGIGHIIGRLDDLNPITADEANIFSLKDFVAQGDGNYVWENNAIDYKLFEGHTYRLTLDCYDVNDPNPNNVTLLGTLYVDFQGASAGAAVYSSIRPVSIDPAPGSMITVDTNVVTVTFDGPVTFKSGYATYGGQGAPTTKVSAAAANDDNTAWNVTIPASFIANNFGGLDVIASFVDADGHYVITEQETQYLYNYWGVAENQYTQIAWHYNCIEGGKTVDVLPADGSTVSNLYEFKMSYSKGIGWGAISPNAVELLDANNQRVAMGYGVATQADAEGWTSESDQVSTWLVLTLNQQITDNGEYTLVIPWEALTLGTEMNADGYKGQTLHYTIADNNVEYTLEPATVLPAPDATQALESIEYVSLYFDENVAVNPAQAEGFISSRTGEQFVGTFEVNSIDAKEVIFRPTTAVTGAGVYTLVIGRNTIGNAEWAASDMTAGKANDEMMFFWTIAGSSSDLAQVSACSILPEEMVGRVGLVTMTVPGAFAAADDAVAELKCVWNEEVEPVYAPLKSAVIGDVTYLIADFGSIDLIQREIYALSFSDWAVEGVAPFSVEFSGAYTQMAFANVFTTAYTGDEHFDVAATSQVIPLGETVNVGAAAADLNWNLELFLNDEPFQGGGIMPFDNLFDDPQPARIMAMVPVEDEYTDIEVRYTLNVDVVYDFTNSAEGVLSELGEVTVKVVDGKIVVEGLADGDIVTVYSLNALTVAKAAATESGAVTISGLNTGATYVVAVNRGTSAKAAAKVAL